MDTKKITPIFWVVAGLALMWNLIGVANFAGTVFMTPETLASLPAEQQEMYIDNPMWMKITFAIATIAGTIGSIGLLMRKKWATLVLFVSMIAVIIQMGYSSFFTNALELTKTPLYFPMMVIGFSIFIWYYAAKMNREGFLN